jgi:hypothetical protein
MMKKSISKIAPVACALALFQAAPASSQDASGASSTPFTETLHFPSVKVTGPSLNIRYTFTKTDPRVAPDSPPYAEHFSNKVFRLYENGKIWLGFYRLVGDPETDDKFTGYYLNAPLSEDDPVLYITYEYDNKTGTFKEELVLPDGTIIHEEGTFEIIGDGDQ